MYEELEVYFADAAAGPSCLVLVWTAQCMRAGLVVRPHCSEKFLRYAKRNDFVRSTVADAATLERFLAS